MRQAGKIIDIAVTDLTVVFHLTQSLLQQQDSCSHTLRLVPKQSRLPSTRWIVLISSFLESLQVSLIPKLFALFSTSESLTPTSSFRLYKLDRAALLWI
jgi:hypothetical protein